MLTGFRKYLSRYADLSDEDIELIKSHCTVRSCDRRVRLTDLGEVEQNLYFVAKGMIRKYFLKDEEEVITHITVEGEALASGASFFSQQPSRYIIDTVEPSVLVTFSREQFFRLVQSHKKWQKLARLLMTEFLVKKEYWLIDSIRYTPRERFLEFMQTRPDLIQRVPQKYLASYLNIKPETFSRLKHLLVPKTS